MQSIQTKYIKTLKLISKYNSPLCFENSDVIIKLFPAWHVTITWNVSPARTQTDQMDQNRLSPCFCHDRTDRRPSRGPRWSEADDVDCLILLHGIGAELKDVGSGHKSWKYHSILQHCEISMWNFTDSEKYLFQNYAALGLTETNH